MSVIVKCGGGKSEEEKTVTAGTSVMEVLPSSGKTMKKVNVNPTPSQSKTVTPSTLQQTVSPDSGKLLSQVIVKAMEDVTPEVTAQTPIITQIAENLGVTIMTPSGTNKQILQGNNANLLNIKNNAKKEGAYVWKKLTADGGTFVDYVVDNNESKYPDGGTQDGYWYERGLGIDLSALGCTKAVTEKITPSSRTSKIYHSLGITPKIVIVTTESTAVGQYYTQGFIVARFSLKTAAEELLLGGAFDYPSGASDISNHNVSSLTSEYIDIGEYFAAGVEYIVTTIG